MSRTVSEVAHQVADNIERDGHLGHSLDESQTRGHCVILNPACDVELATERDDKVVREFWRALQSRLGLRNSHSALGRWSDNTDTEEVLAVLRSM